MLTDRSEPVPSASAQHVVHAVGCMFLLAVGLVVVIFAMVLMCRARRYAALALIRTVGMQAHFILTPHPGAYLR